MSVNGSLVHQVEVRLTDICRFNESRHEAKRNNESYKYIYSFNTLKTYLEMNNLFVKWCKNNCDCSHVKTIEDLKIYGDEYLEYCKAQNQSHWTLATKKSALNKMYGYRSNEYFKFQVPKKLRKDIKRSRDIEKSLKRFDINNERNYKQVVFTKCSGLRIHELEKLRFKDCYFDNKGNAWIHVKQGKGGRKRDVKLYGPPNELQLCIDMIKAGKSRNKNERIFPNPNRAISTHTYRAEYCSRVYNAEKRDLSQLTRSEKVYCRKDRKGEICDRKALLTASKMLGHNRSTVINSSYIY